MLFLKKVARQIRMSCSSFSFPTQDSVLEKGFVLMPGFDL